MRRVVGSWALVLVAALAAPGAFAQATPGVTATEIRIGNTNPYSGPAAAWGAIGRTLSAFFRMINDQGGINGRRISFLSYDDGYSPPRTLEQVRRLIEQDDVLLIFQSLATEPNRAIRDYLNEAGIPQLFIATGATLFNDPVNFPWTLPWNPSARTEAQIYGRYILQNFPNAKVGVLYQNDGNAHDVLEGLAETLGGMVEVIALPYDVTDATVDAQIAALQAAGADVFINASAPRFATLAIRRAAEVGWAPHHILVSTSISVGGVLAPAGIQNAIGIVSAAYMKDPGFAGWAADPDVIAFKAFLAAYHPEGDPHGVFEVYAYAVASAFVEVLRRAGEDLSRANVLRVATSLVDVEVPMLLPGSRVSTSPTDYLPIGQFGMVRFDGTAFVPFGPLIGVAGP